MTATAEDLLDVIAEELGVERAALNPSASLDALDIASLDLVNLGLEIERRFGVEVGQDDLKGSRTLNDVLTMIAAKANARIQHG